MTDNRVSITLTFATDQRPTLIAAGVTDAIAQRFPDELIGTHWDGFSVADGDDEGWPGKVLPCGITYVNGEPTT